jgi:Na+-transporting NADH:ubiquinone oxidoreductase subunit NqrB
MVEFIRDAENKKNIMILVLVDLFRMQSMKR